MPTDRHPYLRGGGRVTDGTRERIERALGPGSSLRSGLAVTGGAEAAASAARLADTTRKMRYTNRKTTMVLITR